MTLPNRRYSVPITSDTMVPRCMPGQMALADPEQSVQVDCEVLVIVKEPDARAAHWRAISGGWCAVGPSRVSVRHEPLS